MSPIFKIVRRGFNVTTCKYREDKELQKKVTSDIKIQIPRMMRAPARRHARVEHGFFNGFNGLMSLAFVSICKHDCCTSDMKVTLKK